MKNKKLITEYTASMVAKITGLKPRMQDYYVWNGFITPSGVQTGKYRKWTIVDLISLRVMIKLHDQVGATALRKVATYLQSVGEDFSNASLVIAGEDVMLIHEPDEIVSLLKKPGQKAFITMVIDLAEAEQEVRAKIQELAA